MVLLDIDIPAVAGYHYMKSGWNSWSLNCEYSFLPAPYVAHTFLLAGAEAIKGGDIPRCSDDTGCKPSLLHVSQSCRSVDSCRRRWRGTPRGREAGSSWVIERAADSQFPLRNDMSIDHRASEVIVSQEFLDGAYVVALFQE